MVSVTGSAATPTGKAPTGIVYITVASGDDEAALAPVSRISTTRRTTSTLTSNRDIGFSSPGGSTCRGPDHAITRGQPPGRGPIYAAGAEMSILTPWRLPGHLARWDDVDQGKGRGGPGGQGVGHAPGGIAALSPRSRRLPEPRPTPRP